MRVLFLGQTGVNKLRCVERLAIHCLRTAGLPGDLDNIRSRKFLRVLHVEDEITSRVAGDYIAYLDQFHRNYQQRIWAEAWDSIMSEVSDSGPEHVFVTMHGTYFRKNRFFAVIDPPRVHGFKPSHVITLFDDAFECWNRIQERERERPRSTVVKLRDVFLWRTVEIMAGDFLVHGTTSIPHFIVATKHPSEMVRRLIFEPTRKRVYLSFPITSTRDDPDSRSEVDDFRNALHEEFTAFDPVTIDERVVVVAFKASGECDEVELKLEERWALGYEEGFEPMAPPFDSEYPLKIPKDQVSESIDDIDRQIEARDFRLIDQAEAAAAYRPSFRKHHSRGVNAELLYAGQSAGIPVHLVWDDSEDGEYGSSPFGHVGTKHQLISEIIKAVNG